MEVKLEKTKTEIYEDFQWESIDLMTLCPTSQFWDFRSHSWGMRRSLLPSRVSPYKAEFNKRIRSYRDVRKSYEQSAYNQYWVPPPTREMKMNESFKYSKEKMNPKSKPFMPRRSPKSLRTTKEEQKLDGNNGEGSKNLFSLKNVKDQNSLHLNEIKAKDFNDKEKKDKVTTTSKKARKQLNPFSRLFVKREPEEEKVEKVKKVEKTKEIELISMITKYSFAEILSVFKGMGNFSGISVTFDSNGQKEVTEKAVPGTLNITRKMEDVLCISKPRYILEHEVAGLIRANRRIPLGQRTNFTANSCNDLSMKFLHDLDNELKNIGNLKILDEEDAEKEEDSDEEDSAFKMQSDFCQRKDFAEILAKE